MVQSGCMAMGGRRFGGFSAKPSPYRESGRLSASLTSGVEKDGAHGPTSTWALRFHGLGLKTITHLLLVDRSPDKIETLKVSDGHVVDIARMHRSYATTRSNGRHWMSTSMYISGFAPMGVESSS